MLSSPMIYHAQSAVIVWGCLGLAVGLPRLLLVLLCAHFAWAAAYGGHLPWGKLVKLAMVGPLGLGTVVAYPVLLAPAEQTVYLPYMSRFINFAVLGNVAMMSLLPTHGVWRGFTHKFACLALSGWLWRMMQQREFETTEFASSGLFVFNAVSLDWVLCHAAYRLVMITLPSFYTFKYVTLELNSLAMTAALHYAWQSEHRPTAHFFGMADTVCAASFSIISTLSFVDNDQQSTTSAALTTRGTIIDMVGVVVHTLVCVVAVAQMGAVYDA